jgi:tetratricopeptide (TPR) repeat protein
MITFTVFVVIAFGHSTFVRNMIWKTEESLWLDAADKYPNSPRTHHNLGRFYANTLQLDKAVSEYKLALEKTRGSHGQTHHLTHYNLALVYLKQNKLQEARRHLEEAVQIIPAFASAYINLSITMVKEEDYDQAQDYLIKALTYDTRKPQAHNNLGYILLKMGRFDEAIHEFQEALALDNKFGIARVNLGIANKYKGNYKKAAYNFRAALRDRPRDLAARLHLAETYYRMGKKESASRMVSDAMDLLEQKSSTRISIRSPETCPRWNFPTSPLSCPC